MQTSAHVKTQAERTAHVFSPLGTAKRQGTSPRHFRTATRVTAQAMRWYGTPASGVRSRSSSLAQAQKTSRRAETHSSLSLL